MAIEIKGIRAKALKAAANLDRINAAYDTFNEAAPLHAADVEGLAPQITALQDDLQFAAQVLGNSAGQSDKQSGEQQVVKSADVGKVEAVVSSPEVEQEQTFPVQPDDEPK